MMKTQSNDPILFQQFSIKNESKFRLLMNSLEMIEGEDYYLLSDSKAIYAI